MPSARQRAEAAVARADRDLSAALPSLRATVAELGTADPASRSLAHRALGHALLHGGRADDAATELRAAVRLAEWSEEPALAAQARTKLAFALHLTGRLSAARRQADRAVADAPDAVDVARALGTRALIHRETGRLDLALADLDAAIATLRRAGDELGLQRVLINRAILRIDIGACSAARLDLREAELIATRLGRPAAVALIASNLGYAASRAGDVPEAIAEYSRAEDGFRAHGLQLSGLLMDRAELLTRVGLVAEATNDAEAALDAAEAERRTLRIPEARLLLARCAAASGDRRLAYEQARRARDGFRRQERAVWAAAAEVQRASGYRALGGRPRWRAIVVAAATLRSAGWDADAVEGYLLAASLAPEPDRSDALAAAAAHRSRGPALVRARAWYAQAVLKADRPERARHAVRRGLTILDDHLSGVGADELRAGLARHRLELAGLGVDLALAHGRPSQVFDAVERARATVLVRDAVRPPNDPELADLLSRHRAARSERERTALAGLVRDRSRIARDAGELLRPAPMSEVDAALGDAALVTWFARGHRLYALTRVAGRTRLHHLGAEQPLRAAVDRLSFAMHRLAAEGVDHGRFGRSLEQLLGTAAVEVQASLLASLPETTERELVLIPPAFLHQVPWHELPGLNGRPVVVASSVRQWRRASVAAETGATGPANVLVAAGPGLPGARREAAAVAVIHGTVPLLDPDARVQTVLDALAGADLAHLATHGRLRPDNPQFSELTMSDGALLVHHLDTIDALPPTLILASCDSGRPVSRPGEALLGFAAACLIRGTRTLIAPVAPVPDGGTETVMTRLHAGLAAGEPPAAALASAQSDAAPGHRAFACFGAGLGVQIPPNCVG
ncbi:MAG: CHAT domain-containing protein [Micropruina sp.]